MPNLPDSVLPSLYMWLHTCYLRQARGLCEIPFNGPAVAKGVFRGVDLPRAAVAKLPSARRWWRDLRRQGIDLDDGLEAEIATELAFGDGHYAERKDRLDLVVGRLRSQRKPIKCAEMFRALAEAAQWASAVWSQLKYLDELRETQAERDRVVKDARCALESLCRFLGDPRRAIGMLPDVENIKTKAADLLATLELKAVVRWTARFPPADPTEADGPRLIRPGVLGVPGYPKVAGFKGHHPSGWRLTRPRRGSPSAPWVQKAKRSLKAAGLPADIADELLDIFGLRPRERLGTSSPRRPESLA